MCAFALQLKHDRRDIYRAGLLYICPDSLRPCPDARGSSRVIAWAGGLLGSGNTEGIPARLMMVDGFSIEGILVGTDGAILLIETGLGR